MTDQNPEAKNPLGEMKPFTIAIPVAVARLPEQAQDKVVSASGDLAAGSADFRLIGVVWIQTTWKRDCHPMVFLQYVVRDHPYLTREDFQSVRITDAGSARPDADPSTWQRSACPGRLTTRCRTEVSVERSRTISASGSQEGLSCGVALPHALPPVSPQLHLLVVPRRRR